MAPGMIQINSNSNGPNSENGKFTAMSNVVEPISLSNDHSTDKTITNGISNNDNCYPIAVLMCRKNSSHPFDERRLPLNSPAKVGRAVARAKPSEENAIFDCKVLSRNHALVWFEDGKVIHNQPNFIINQPNFIINQSHISILSYIICLYECLPFQNDDSVNIDGDMNVDQFACLYFVISKLLSICYAFIILYM